jgi:hypothetical protein
MSVWWDNEERVAITMVGQSGRCSVPFNVPEGDAEPHPVSLFQEA